MPRAEQVTHRNRRVACEVSRETGFDLGNRNDLPRAKRLCVESVQFAVVERAAASGQVDVAQEQRQVALEVDAEAAVAAEVAASFQAHFEAAAAELHHGHGIGGSLRI